MFIITSERKDCKETHILQKLQQVLTKVSDNSLEFYFLCKTSYNIEFMHCLWNNKIMGGVIKKKTKGVEPDFLRCVG